MHAYMHSLYDCYVSVSDYIVLKNFTWADQRAKVCFIFHKVQLRCQECFIKQEQCFMKLQSLIKYSYA